MVPARIQPSRARLHLITSSRAIIIIITTQARRGSGSRRVATYVEVLLDVLQALASSLEEQHVLLQLVLQLMSLLVLLLTWKYSSICSRLLPLVSGKKAQRYTAVITVVTLNQHSRSMAHIPTGGEGGGRSVRPEIRSQQQQQIQALSNQAEPADVVCPQNTPLDVRKNSLRMLYQ